MCIINRKDALTPLLSELGEEGWAELQAARSSWAMVVDERHERITIRVSGCKGHLWPTNLERASSRGSRPGGGGPPGSERDSEGSTKRAVEDSSMGRAGGKDKGYRWFISDWDYGRTGLRWWWSEDWGHQRLRQWWQDSPVEEDVREKWIARGGRRNKIVGSFVYGCPFRIWDSRHMLS